MKGRFLCTLLGAAGSVVWLSVASAQTMSADASFGEHASLRLTKATLRAQEASRRSSKSSVRARIAIPAAGATTSAPLKVSFVFTRAGGTDSSRSGPPKCPFHVDHPVFVVTAPVAKG